MSDARPLRCAHSQVLLGLLAGRWSTACPKTTNQQAAAGPAPSLGKVGDRQTKGSRTFLSTDDTILLISLVDLPGYRLGETMGEPAVPVGGPSAGPDSSRDDDHVRFIPITAKTLFAPPDQRGALTLPRPYARIARSPSS